MTQLPPGVEIRGRECKHAIYVVAQDNSPNDLLVVKEYEHRSDGTRVPYLRQIVNYKRPFWVTKENFRKHTDKKEWEVQERLMKYESTQINLIKSIGRALGRAPTQTSLRMLARSPYLYGCDVTTPVLAKHHYMEKWPTCVSDNSVAVLDTETDMVHGHEEIIMVSLTMKSRAKIVIVNEFFEGSGIYDPAAAIQAGFEKYLGEYKEKRNIVLEVEFAKNAGEAVAKIIQTAHVWQPDIMAIWNMNFDVPKMVSMLEKYGYDPAEVFSDPSVRRPFRFFKYIEGPEQKVTASGKSMALAPAERWHQVIAPASFYILDAMCVYYKLRIAKGKEPSYALDAILSKHLGIRKLKFEEANGYYGGAWHQFMQKNYKVEYCIYNLFDCISMELLDEKTTDLKYQCSSLCGHSEYHRFGSQPRRTCDDLHFVCLEEGKVIATTSDKMEDDNDQYVVGLTDWIVTLPSYLVSDDGLKVIEELPDVPTLIYAQVADLDVEGTYPNIEIIANISKETTSRELSRIQGIDEVTQRSIGINLSGGHVNAVEISCALFKAPTMDMLLADFKEKHMPNSRARPAMTAALEAEQRPTGLGVEDLETTFAAVEQAVTQIGIPAPVPVEFVETDFPF